MSLSLVSVTAVLGACGGSTGSASSAPTSSALKAGDTVERTVPATLCADRSTEPTVEVAQLAPAIDLVRGTESSLALSEVNVTQNEVNVFVVRDGREYPYVVCGSQVIAPEGDAEPYSGATFTIAQLDLSPNILDTVEAVIKDAHVVAFSVTPGPDGSLEFIATLTAPSGQFRVLLAADGSVLATE